MYVFWALILWGSFVLIVGHPHYGQHVNRQRFSNDGYYARPTQAQQSLAYPLYHNQRWEDQIKPIRPPPRRHNNAPPFANLEVSSTENRPQYEAPNDDQESATTYPNDDQESVTTSQESYTTSKQNNNNKKPDKNKETEQNIKAVAVLRGKAKGTLFFEQIGDKVHVTGSISGLTNGLHAFHVHHYGDLTRSCESSGDHFNPHNTKHGSPFDSVRHVGDLGNVFADESGVATIDIKDKFLSLKAGKNNILAHTIIVHDLVDDLGRGGHVKSGTRIGCGIIGMRNLLE